MDPTLPEADTMLVDGDRFVAVGTTDQLQGWLRPGDAVVDLGGYAVVPGLIDAHAHFDWFSQGLTQVDLDGVTSLAEALALVAERAARTPTATVIRGKGFNANLWERRPTARDLDTVAPDHRVVIASKDCHTLWVNSRVMREAGVTRSTADVAGGQIIRDADGEPTGVFQENAQDLVRHIVPQATREELMNAIRAGMRYANSVGVTSVHDMDGIDCFRALQALNARGELSVRFCKQIPEAAIDWACGAGLTTGFGNEWVRVGSVKVFTDGSLGSKTAWMLEGYEGAPDYLGVATHSYDSFLAVVEKAVRHDLSVAVHAIGDAANRMVLDVFAQVAGESRTRGLRHRVEHCQLLTEADIPRFGQLNVIASVQPSHAPSDRYIADAYWGGRSRFAYAFRSLADSGARLALGSDVPVEIMDPLAGIHAAVWRKRLSEPESAPWQGEQRLTVEEALYGFTMGAAYTSGEEHLKGSITPGKLADFVVLTHDIRSGAEEVLANVRPRATVVGGRLVFGEL
jgi:predicted amidohydrolase YtcJ